MKLFSNKNNTTNKSPGPGSFTGEFHQTSNEEHLLFSNFPKNWRGEKAPKLILWVWHYCDTKTTQRKLQKRKLQVNPPDEHRYIFLNKILANWIQQYIKKITHHDQVGFIPGMQCCWFNICKSINMKHHINKLKEKIILSSQYMQKNHLEKIQHQFMIKTLNKVGIEGTYLNTIKTIRDRLTANITLNGESLKCFP